MVVVRIGPCCHPYRLHNKIKNALYYIVLICLAEPLSIHRTVATSSLNSFIEQVHAYTPLSSQ